MEFSLREWLILIGVVIIVVILIDGFRRYKKGQEYAQADNDFSDIDESDDDALVRQGSAVGYSKVSSSERVKSSQDPIVNAFENARKTAKSPLADVPHKVDSGPELDRGEEMHLDELASLVPERDFGDSAVSEQNYSDDGFYEQDDLDLDFAIETNNSYDGHFDEDYERSYSEIDIDQVTPNSVIDGINEGDQEDNSIAEIEEVIVINIFAPEEQNFSGMELLQLILNCGMRYGEMDIFHRHEDG
ncbi:MAG: cell division protein ZipA, partial [Gammaproteobacteria bacterium]|nr:cell division protein ZipA [Gammaproteobacteria bacterium]